MRLLGSVVIAGLALAGCKQGQAGGQAQGPQTPTVDPATALPNDAVIAEALLKDHARDCEKTMVYSRSSTSYMPDSAPLPQVERERAAFVEAFKKEKNLHIGATVVHYAIVRTGEPTNFTIHYAAASTEHPEVTDPLEFTIQKEVSQEGALISLSYSFSLCPVTARSVSIVDHEFDKNSDKTVTIRYQVAYGASNALTLLTDLANRGPSINPGLANIAMRYGSVPPPRSGIAVLHRNDVTGWTIESEQLH